MKLQAMVAKAFDRASFKWPVFNPELVGCPANVQKFLPLLGERAAVRGIPVGGTPF